MAGSAGWREVRWPRKPGQFGAHGAESEPPVVSNAPDSYTARVIKLIPAEVISLYVTLDALIRGAKPTPSALLEWVAFVAGLLGTPYFLYFISRVRSASQITISTAAFVVWVLAIGGPFDGQVPALAGAVLLVLFTFAVPAARV